MKKRSFITLLCLLLGVAAYSQDDEGDMNVPPRGKKAVMTVITEPANSDVYLGGKFLGKSPITEMTVKSGRQNLVIVDQGYELVNVRFNVWPDSNNTYNARTVIPKGTIDVSTNPPKCQIYVDGEMADFTDGAALTIKNLDAGDHLVGAKCGGKMKEQMVKVKGEETSTILIDFKAKK